MERKIGEIFEFGDEWLQCVEQPKKYDKTVCALCAFQGNGNCELDRCSGTYRSDKKFVIFKKLEKVGKPYKFDGHLFQSYRTFEVPIFTENYATVRPLGDNSKISIEIKQTKEDMEEKNNAKHSNSEKIGKNLKEFDLEAAKSGKPVCTRDGRKARLICFDKKGAYPIVALVNDYNEEEYIKNYDEFGKKFIGGETSDDLMMLPEKKERWVNVYKELCYESKEEAIRHIAPGTHYIDTIRVEWEDKE